MVVIFGTRTIGQADRVDKLFWTATEFFHIFWVPLFPVAGRLVLDDRHVKKMRKQGKPLPRDIRSEADEEPQKPPAEDAADKPTADSAADEAPAAGDEEIHLLLPMSGKSVLLGYLRGWGFALTLFCGFLGGMLAAMSGDDPWAAAMFPKFLYVAGGGFVVAIASYYGPWNSASPARAKRLCETAELSTDHLPKEMQDELREMPEDR